MDALFEIETDRVKVVLHAPRGSPPPENLSMGAGRLAIRPVRPGLKIERIARAGVPEQAGKDLGCVLGPRLHEQTAYSAFVRGRAARPVRLKHRDPVIVQEVRLEEGESLAHGPINFKGQIGYSTFIVVVDGQVELELDVEVFPSKLDYKDDYDEILGAIQRRFTALALEYLRSTYQHGAKRCEPEPSNLEWLVLLTSVADDLERALRHVAERPVRGLTRDPVVVRCDRVKRVDAAVRALVRRGGGGGGWATLEAGTPARERLIERRARPTLDTPEHRWLARQLERITQRLASIRGEESASVAAEAYRPTSARSQKTIDDLQQLERRIQRLGALECFAVAGGDAPSGFASLQLLGTPGYREAYQACLVLSLGLRVEGGPLQLSLKDLSVLYEYWCFLALLEIISKVTKTSIPPEDVLELRATGLHVTLGRGRVVRFKTSTGRRVALFYNPSFDTNDMLLAQRPDMLIELNDPDWPALVLLLDAKYRLDDSPAYVKSYGAPGPPEDAVNTLHRYRDAILERAPDPDGRPKRLVIQAVAVFPYREQQPGDFGKSQLWGSLARIGIGAIPLLPGSTSYLECWLRDALERGSWSLADRTLAHVAERRSAEWRAAAAEPVLVGVLRGEDPRQHLAWVSETRRYYARLTKSPRQLAARWVAIYSPTRLAKKGAVTHRSAVERIEVVDRQKISTPWASSRGGICVLYHLAEVQELKRPIENTGERFANSRWTSRLGLERAARVRELFLETEPEWRLYEGLKAAGTDFELRDPDKPELQDPKDPRGRVWFVRGERRARYEGASGFVVTPSVGREAPLLSVDEAAVALQSPCTQP